MSQNPQDDSKQLPPYQSMLERHPEHVKAIGMIAIEMANLEIMLAQLLGALLNLRPAVADAIYFSPQATGPRFSILENTSEEVLTPEPLKELRKIFSDARSIQGKRNDHVHNAWGLSAETGRVESSKLPLKGRAKLVPINELQDLLLRLRRLITRVIEISPEIHTFVWGETLQKRSEQEARSRDNRSRGSPKSSSKRPRPRGRKKSSRA